MSDSSSTVSDAKHLQVRVYGRTIYLELLAQYIKTLEGLSMAANSLSTMLSLLRIMSALLATSTENGQFLNGGGGTVPT